MKYIVIFFVSLFGAQIGTGQGIVFENDSWESILLKAKKENKPIFVDCTTVWCKPCKWMEKNIFTLENVGNYFNSNFINVQMDMEKGDGIQLGKEFDIHSYPTYLFINPDGKLIHKEGGAKPEEVFIGLANKALDPARNLEGMNEAYAAGERSRDFLQNYIIALGKAKQNLKQKKIFGNYFNAHNTQELLNSKDYEVILSAVTPSDEQFLFLLENHEAYKELVGAQRFDSRVYAKLVFDFSRMARKQPLEEIREKAAEYKQFYVPAVQKAEDMATIRFYRKHKEIKLLTHASIKYLSDYTQGDPAMVVYFMNMVLDGPYDESHSGMYQEAISFVEESIKKYPNIPKLLEVHEKLLEKSLGDHGGM